MKLSTICQWALVGIGAEIRSLRFQETTCLYHEEYQRAEVFHAMSNDAMVTEQNIVDVIAKIMKGEIIDEEY